MKSSLYWNSSSPMAVAAALFVSWTVGCGSGDDRVTSATSKYKVADTESSGLVPTAIESPARGGGPNDGQSTSLGTPPAVTRSAPERPSSQPPASVNPTAPNGSSPQDLLAFINDLKNREPVGASREAALVDFQQNQQQIIRTADQLMRGGASETEMLAATEAKLTALHALSQAEVKGAHEALLSFCEELRSNSNPALAERGTEVGFFVRVNAFALGQTEDPTAMLSDFRTLLAGSTKDVQLLTLARQIAAILQQRNFGQEAYQLYLDTAAGFANVQDPSLIASVKLLQEEADVAATNIRNKLLAATQQEPGAEQEFLEAARQLLASNRRGPVTSGFLLEAAFTLESNNRSDLAHCLYTEIAPAFDGHPDAELVAGVREKVDRYSRRIGLVGQPFSVEGVDLNHLPLDWTQYRGKVVLVDFWATWCRPCLEEIPNIKANYEQFRNKGFEVIGVNLDEDPSSLESFFSLQSLPWPTVVSADPQKRGMQTPLAVRCGIDFIPFLVLVGRDGRVAALNVRDKELGPKLAELLAEPIPTGG